MERLTIKAPSGLIHLKNSAETTINMAIKKLSDYEDLGLEPSEIKPYIYLAEKMNVCDLVREIKRLSEKIRFLEAQI